METPGRCIIQDNVGGNSRPTLELNCGGCRESESRDESAVVGWALALRTRHNRLHGMRIFGGTAVVRSHPRVADSMELVFPSERARTGWNSTMAPGGGRCNNMISPIFCKRILCSKALEMR